MMNEAPKFLRERSIFMYIKNLIETIEQNKNVLNSRVYRTMLAKAYCYFYAQKYSNKSEIQFQVNVELTKRNMKHVSHTFVVDTLKK